MFKPKSFQVLKLVKRRMPSWRTFCFLQESAWRTHTHCYWRHFWLGRFNLPDMVTEPRETTTLAEVLKLWCPDAAIPFAQASKDARDQLQSGTSVWSLLKKLMLPNKKDYRNWDGLFYSAELGWIQILSAKIEKKFKKFGWVRPKCLTTFQPNYAEFLS